MRICYTLVVKIGESVMMCFSSCFIVYYGEPSSLLFEKFASPARMGVYLWKSLL